MNSFPSQGGQDPLVQMTAPHVSLNCLMKLSSVGEPT